MNRMEEEERNRRDNFGSGPLPQYQEVGMDG